MTSSSSFGEVSTPGQTQTRLGPRVYPFTTPRLLYCADQMLAVMLLSHYRVSLSKTDRPRALCGARCIGHAVSTWSAVCSEFNLICNGIMVLTEPLTHLVLVVFKRLFPLESFRPTLVRRNRRQCHLRESMFCIWLKNVESNFINWFRGKKLTIGCALTCAASE